MSVIETSATSAATTNRRSFMGPEARKPHTVRRWPVILSWSPQLRTEYGPYPFVPGSFDPREVAALTATWDDEILSTGRDLSPWSQKVVIGLSA